MISIDKQQSTMPATPKVDIVLQNLIDSREQLPEEIHDIIISHYQERLNRANKTIMVGAYAVDILSDLLNVPLDKGRLLHAYKAWSYLYSHALIIDDLLDNQTCLNKRELLIASQWLFDLALDIITNLDDGYCISLIKRCVQYRIQSWQSMNKETTSSSTDSLDYFTESNLSVHGRKAALAKLCACMILHCSGNICVNQVQESAVDSLCIAIQLLDDVDDFIEDFCAKRRNYLVCETEKYLSSLSHNKQRFWTFDPEDAFKLAIISGSFNKAWELCSDHIKILLSLLDQESKHGSSAFFTQLSLDCDRQSNILKSYLSQHIFVKTDPCHIQLQNTFGLHSFIIEDSVWDELLNIAKSGPKACN